MCLMVRAGPVPGRDACVWLRLHLRRRRSRGLLGGGELQDRILPSPQLQYPLRAKYVDLHYETDEHAVIEEVLPEECVCRNPVAFLDHRGDHGPEQGALQD